MYVLYNKTHYLMIGQEGEIHIDLSGIGTPHKNAHQIDALVLLNSDISDSLLDYFVSVSRTIVLCDGGANLFYRSKHRDTPSLIAIVGDLDSIEYEVRSYYTSRVDIVDLSADQDTNDFEKGLSYAIKHGSKRIASLGVLGRRFDQEMCNLSVLQKYSQTYPNSQFLALGHSSVICVIKPHIKTTIKVGKEFVKDQAGMIVFGKARVETKGFKWNLGKEAGLEELEWGVIVSSSNKIVGDQVTIISSHTLFFTIQVNTSL